ncbi:MAG: gliding motility-associated C-terminal domain-containing protein [Fibrobacteria bacterium]|nr:gliding motility-associated C-terminal domain-containing protein [Fibrobacteria bacterium]
MKYKQPYFKNLPIAFYILGVLAMISPLQALIGDWQSWTHLDAIVCLKTFEGEVYAGTSGGIRKINPVNNHETIFNNPVDGFWDVDIAGMTITGDNKLWVAAHSGILYQLASSNEWQTIDRGFASINWRLNTRAVSSVDKYILLGFNKGLSFFNCENGQVDINLTSFGESREASVLSVHPTGKWLYIGTSAGVFRGKIYWEDVRNPPESGEYGNIFNPQIWEFIDSSSTIGLITGEPDNIQYYPSGSSITAPEGIAIPGNGLEVNGETYGSLSTMEALTEVDGIIFAGGPSGLHKIENGKIHSITNKHSLPSGRVANVRVSDKGVYIWNLSMDGAFSTGVYRLQGNSWQAYPGFALSQGLEPILNRMQSLQIRSEDEFYLGNWGFGILHYKNQGQVVYTNQNSCLDDVVGIPNYVVAWSTVSWKDRGLFTSLYRLEGSFSLAFLNYESNNITCYGQEIVQSTALMPSQLSISRDSLLFVSTESGVESYLIEETASGISLSHKWHLDPPPTTEARISSTILDDFDRLWVVTTDKLFYLDEYLLKLKQAEEDVHKENQPDMSLTGLEQPGAENCHHAIKDEGGTLWLGCSNGLFNIIPGEKTPVREYKRFRNRDGLLSEEITHMHLDKQTGHLWMVTENGLNRLESSGRTISSTLKSAKVYPNPFRAHHQYVIFEDITVSSMVYVFNQSGDMVFSATADESSGGQVKWDGKNTSGNKVKPGVYYYVIKSGSRVVKGKLILAW